jgi:hypothetical protein
MDLCEWLGSFAIYHLSTPLGFENPKGTAAASPIEPQGVLRHAEWESAGRVATLYPETQHYGPKGAAVPTARSHQRLRVKHRHPQGVFAGSHPAAG